jgi:hypothetical protein
LKSPLIEHGKTQIFEYDESIGKVRRSFAEKRWLRESFQTMERCTVHLCADHGAILPLESGWPARALADHLSLKLWRFGL